MILKSLESLREEYKVWKESSKIYSDILFNRHFKSRSWEIIQMIRNLIKKGIVYFYNAFKVFFNNLYIFYTNI